KKMREIGLGIEHQRLLVRYRRPLGGQSNCSREESNLRGFPHTVLSRTRLPVPPREQKQRGSYNAGVAVCLQGENGESACLNQADRFLRARTSNWWALRT